MLSGRLCGIRYSLGGIAEDGLEVTVLQLRLLQLRTAGDLLQADTHRTSPNYIH